MLSSASFVISICCLSSAFALISIRSSKLSTSLNAKSKSVPFLDQPPALTGKLPGDVGFDPLGLSSKWADVSYLDCVLISIDNE